MSDGAAADIGPRQAWVIAILLWLSVVGITAYEIAPASVLGLVATDLGISQTGVSWLVSLLLLGMVIASLPAGLVLDRVDNRHAVLVVSLAFLASTGWAALAAESGSLWSLWAARVAGGVMNVTLWTAAISIVGAIFGPDRQGTSIGFMTTSIPAGFTLAHVSMPPMATTIGWEYGFVVFGLISLLSAAAFWGYTRSLPLRTSYATPSRREFGLVLRNRLVWAVSVVAFVAFSLNMFFNNWLPTYLVEEFGLSLAESGVFAAAFPAVGAVARFLSGSISDRLFGGQRRPIVRWSLVVIVPLIVLIAVLETIVILLVALVVAGFVTQMGLALLLPYVRELVPANVAATSLSVLNMVGLAGAFSAPVLTGLLIDASGSYTMAFAYAAGLAVLGLAITWVTPEPAALTTETNPGG